jgi:hypothetical protein
MATFYRDFSADTIGALPADFTSQWTNAQYTQDVQAYTGAPGDKVFTFRRTGGSAASSVRLLATMDAIGTPGDVEILSKCSASNGQNFGLALRTQGTTVSGYLLRIGATGATHPFLLQRIDAGTYTTLASWDIPGGAGSGAVIRMRFRAQGTVLKGKFWYEGAAEPSTWQVEYDTVSDATKYATGEVGPHALTANLVGRVVRYQWVGVGTGGDTAPSSAAPVNTPPTVTITSPLDAATYFVGQTVELRATATDAEDGDLTASIVWSSSIAGALGTGGSVDVTTLALGTHTITASVTDSGGLTDSDSVTITVEAAPIPPEPVTVQITLPTTGSTFLQGDPVAFLGAAQDEDGAALTGTSLVWTSSIGGVLGTGETLLLSSLSDGTHTITLTATDALAQTGTASVSITITADAPSLVAVTIAAPTSGTVYAAGETIAFAGSAAYMGDPVTNLVWTSSMAGEIGTGATFALSSLQPGIHTVRLTATAPGGQTGTASVFVVVQPAYALANVPSGAPLWDNVRAKWGKSPGPGSWGAVAGLPADVVVMGGFHDPAVYGMAKLGRALSWRAKAEVLINGRHRWSGLQYYLGQRSVRAGVGLAAGYGTPGAQAQPVYNLTDAQWVTPPPRPTWFGFFATIGAGGSMVSGGANELRVEFLDYRYLDAGTGVPMRQSELGYAGRVVARLPLPKMYAYSDLAGNEGAGVHEFALSLWGTAYLPVEAWYPVELEVTQHAPGVVRLRARILGDYVDGVHIPLPTFDGWHIDTLWGNTGGATHSGGAGDVPPIDMECVYAGPAAKNTWDVVPFQDGYALFRNFEATVLDGGECGEPCSLLLEVYEDDGVTVAWSVATDPEHLHPYLEDVTSYAEQEIDVITGAAVIGQVQYAIVDRRQTQGDQDSGFVTARLAEGIAGRRLRMLRFVDEANGWVTLADGPSGPPEMLEYAGFGGTILDTREWERTLGAFSGMGTTTIWPKGVLDGFGWHDEEWLVEPVTPNDGRYVLRSSGPFTGRHVIDMTYSTGYTGGSPLSTVTPALTLTDDDLNYMHPYQAVAAGYAAPELYRMRDVAIMVRPATGGEWQLVNPVGVDVIVQVRDGQLSDTTPVWYVQGIVVPEDVDLDLTVDATVDVVFLARGEPSEYTPYHLEWMTSGELLMALYDGAFSGDVDTGIRYDMGALLEMDEPVLMRITRPVTDIRAWAEKHIYGPTGWVAALDNDGQISPKFQGWPLPDDDAEATITNAISEPSSDWNAGELVVNRLVYEYPRFIAHAASKSADGIVARAIEIEYIDAASIVRHDEQLVEYDGSAFGAIGDVAGFPVVEEEAGARLAAERDTYILQRFRDGAPAFYVPVMRSATANLRAGDWVDVDISWIPNLDTARRGLVARGQLFAIRDLDCAWRGLLIVFGDLSSTDPGDEPVAAFTWTANMLEVTFDASTSTSGVDIIEYLWDFGDSSPTLSSAASTAVYLFGAAGTYPVTLTITDANGRTDSVTQSVDVSTVPPTILPATQDSAVLDEGDHALVIAPVQMWGDGMSASENLPALTKTKETALVQDAAWLNDENVTKSVE